MTEEELERQVRDDALLAPIEDNPPEAGRQPRDSTGSREDIVRNLHVSALEQLTGLREARDRIEDEIRVLVGEEYRLRRMVGIIDRANKDDGHAQADPS